MNYLIKPSVVIDYVEDELLIYDMETGFSGKGNKYAYLVFSLLKQGIDNEMDIINNLKEHFNKSQHSRIEKSVPNILFWAKERNIIEEK
ncbi:MAG: hypothetical protein HFE30_01015 [Clostridiales bacterium]|nr:hypothetical protein [Clostridiales bacterium]